MTFHIMERCSIVVIVKIPNYKHNIFMVNITVADNIQYKNTNIDELSITLLHPYIDKAITEFYGNSRRYEIGDSDIEILERKGNIFTVKVSVDTFEGAHNNYFTEIMTFTVTPISITLENFLHYDFFSVDE